MNILPPKPLLLPLVLALLFGIIVVTIILTKPKAERRAAPETPQIQVEVVEISPQRLAPQIRSYGKVQALTQSTLVARVNGVVEYVDENFREGGAFKKDQLLVSLDRVDYEIQKRVALAQVAEAESRYSNELALAEEAKHNWRASGRTGEPPPLALRLPQLRAAEAALESAKANASRAELDLKRTEIRAPYDGFILSNNVDLGQHIGANSPVAEIFSAEAAEISLPIKQKDLALLPIDQIDQDKASNAVSEVRFTSTLSGTHRWSGTLVRSAKAIDELSRQLHVLARIDSPFSARDGTPGLKVGEYLTATITGKVLPEVIAVPNQTVYQGSYVYVFDNKRVHRRVVTLGWHNTEISIIESGLSPGDKLVLTPLGQISSGTLATVATQRTPQSKAPGDSAP